MAEIQASPEQKVVLDTWDRGMSIMAGAGSGKTTTLVQKCVALLARNPEAKFAAVSFTERSASDLRAKLSRHLSLNGHWVMTIHGLCGAIIREFPREAGFDGEESMLSEGESQLLWERALQGLWLDALPDAVRDSCDLLLKRESRDSLHDLLKRLRELYSFGILGHLAKSDDGSSRALECVGKYVLDRYERLKRRRGALDFDDLERGADRALEHPRIRESFHRRFDLVLIDEFQDTNPMQARILWRFARPDSSNLCVVGDPKQSIYRFRDADVTVFDDYCARLPVRQSLTWNFRSRPGIIEYANRVCDPAFAASAMTYEALIPKREAVEEEAVVRLDVKSPADLARWVKSEVARGIPFHDMALLLRKIRGNEAWLKALTSEGIPIAVGSGGLFWEDPRVRELVAFFKWWDNPGNTLSGAVFLRAPWLGIQDELLDQWAVADRSWQKPFFESGHAVARSLLEFVGRVVRPGELLMALLASSEIEAELGSPLLGLWHRVEELSSTGLDFHSVVREIALSCELGRRERDVPPPKNQGQLSVLTLHGSKGLEFPHVILIDLGKKGRASDAPLLFWDREKGPYLATRDEDGDREKDHPIEAQWRAEEARKNLAESKRLFYVALTRARERLVLVCPELEDPVKLENAYEVDHWRAWVEMAGEVARPEIPAQSAALSRAAIEPYSRPIVSRAAELKRPRHSVTEWNLLSRCPRAYEWTFIRPVAVAQGVAQIGLFTGDKVERVAETEVSQRELGTRVHSCLERGDFSELKALELEVGSERFSAEPVISWAMSSEWMAPPSEGRDVWTELAFEVPIEREVLVGSIDRLVMNRDRFFLIDFKVTEKAKSVDALLESYQTQMELYAWALKGLDPRAHELPMEALLVNISPRTIQAVPVPIGALKADRLADDAGAIVGGKPGKPKPGPLCRHCEFRPVCPEAAR